MFYPTDILKRRGKFGLIWLAATKGKKINRRQICSIDVANASEDIISVISQHSLSGMTRKVYFSLFLSSHLMAGLVCVHNMQAKILLEDLKCIITRISEPKVLNIDLEKPVNKSKVTCLEPDLNNVPLEFGRILPMPSPSDHFVASDYFLLTTPKSSEGRSETPGSIELDRSLFEPIPDGMESLHTSRREDITLHDEFPLHSEEPIPEIEDEPVDLFAPPFSFFPDLAPDIPLEREVEQIPDVDLRLPSFDTERAIFVTPEVPGEEEHGQFIQIPSMSPAPEETAVSERAAPLSSQDSSATFVLPPVVPGRKKRKRRHLIIDSTTVISAEQMRRNISSANDNLTIPLCIPSRLESADSLMSRLASGFVPKRILERLKHLKTLPQPDETFSRIQRTSISEETPEEFLMEVDVPHVEHISAMDSVEQQRAADEEDTGGPLASKLLKSTSLKTLEGSSSVSARYRSEDTEPPQIVGEEDIEPFYFESVQETELSRPGPELEIPEPELPEAQHEITRISFHDRCISSPVSPERTPPPPSPIPLSDILNEAFELIKEAAASGGENNATTFSFILENIDPTKRRVASLFNSLLYLHASGKIELKQYGTATEIYIKILEEQSP